VWHARPAPYDGNPNVLRLAERAPALAEAFRGRVAQGADPGAVADRQGWIETRLPSGTVFLDEVAEIDAASRSSSSACSRSAASTA